MASLKPLLLNQRDTGGAGNATRRIHEGLREIGVDSCMLVRRQSTDKPRVIGPSSRLGKALARVRPFLDDAPLAITNNSGEFSLDWVPDRLSERIGEVDPDVVHLNWVAGGYMSMSSLGDIDRPLVWRLPDMWAMTGGCHYSNGCDGYEQACGECPKLSSDTAWDLSKLTMKRKKRALSDVPVTVVAPSSWLASCAEDSALFEGCRIEVIPNGLDTDVFHPVDPSIGRELFGLPQDRPLVLFGSVGPLSDSRKGYDLLRDALHELEDSLDVQAELVVFGTEEPSDPPDFGRPVHYTGYLNDEQSLAVLYASSDVMVVPSRYEGFGQTVTEAMACGTPVVAFDSTGPSDTIVHRGTGYLAEPFDVKDLADGIAWVLSTLDEGSTLRENARERAVNNYDYRDIAETYRSLYRDIV